MTKIAIIGCGYWGMNLLRNMVESDKMELICACDSFPRAIERVKTRYPMLKVCTDTEEVFNDKEVQGVVIATDAKSHYALAKKALLKGKDVFVEKPLTTSSKTSRALIKLAEKHQRILMVGHTFEYSPTINKAEEIIKEELGQVIYASFSRVNLGLYRENVSVLWDLAPHDLSIMYKWFKVMPIGVSCFANSFMHPSNDVPDIAMMRLLFDSSMMVNIEVSWVFPLKIRKIVIIGKEKMMIVNEAIDEKIKIYNKGVEIKTPSTYGEYKLIYRSGDVVSPYVDTYEPLRKEMEHFAECIETRNTPLTDGENGLRVVRTIEAAEKSYKNGGKVIKP
ncbi:MAG: Gfo/Idh/MocA family oxidoreductase [Candidatus Aureabacteria bacterium]|nr:Gfo/Idh/MocA family oxidoreductase [Candidatus Auribacterota bacterium]